MKNVLIAQSGGPTSAINATMAGVIQYALISSKVDKIYGGLFGIKGVLDGNLIELTDTFSNCLNLDLLCSTPAAALGSCRYKLKKDEAAFAKIVEVLRKFEIGYFVYIGGNDSMDTVLQLSKYCTENNINDIKIMGAPKTVDNDLCVTDHTPGFGSAAKYIATTIAETICDLRVYDIPVVTIIEIMGRNAGWLTAASVLAGTAGGEKPDLIYLPEVAFDDDKFVEDVKAAMAKKPYVVIAISEGMKDKDGAYLCERMQKRGSDAFGHKMLSGAGRTLEMIVSEKIGCRARVIELNVLQRSAAHLASATDIEESKLLGAAALERAVNGHSGEMSAIIREDSPEYRIRIESTPIERVANNEKTVPLEWLNEAQNYVTEDMINYLLPLIQGERKAYLSDGVPKHIKLY